MQIQKINNQTSFGNIRKVRVDKKIANLTQNSIEAIKKALLSPVLYSLGGDSAYYDLHIFPETKTELIGKFADTHLTYKVSISADKIQTELKKTLFGALKTKDKVIPARYCHSDDVNSESDIISLAQIAIIATENQIATEKSLAEIKLLTK